jgi:hypothetical protein
MMDTEKKPVLNKRRILREECLIPKERDKKANAQTTVTDSEKVHLNINQRPTVHMDMYLLIPD